MTRNSKRKGNTFEREICKKLSLWWSCGASDSIFWRTASSGGRATQRARKDQKTENSHGDVMAIDPAGVPLLKLFTIELKNGYADHDVQDILDSPRGTPSYLEWFHQAEESFRGAGSHSWLVVHKKTRRNTVVWIPIDSFMMLESEGAFTPEPVPTIEVSWSDGMVINTVKGMTFDYFCNKLNPSQVKKFVGMK